MVPLQVNPVGQGFTRGTQDCKLSMFIFGRVIYMSDQVTIFIEHNRKLVRRNSTFRPASWCLEQARTGFLVKKQLSFSTKKVLTHAFNLRDG